MGYEDLRVSSVSHDYAMMWLRDNMYGGCWNAMLSDLRSRMEKLPTSLQKIRERIRTDILYIEEAIRT